MPFLLKLDIGYDNCTLYRISFLNLGYESEVVTNC
jgi:hypothetical protein